MEGKKTMNVEQLLNEPKTLAEIRFNKWLEKCPVDYHEIYSSSTDQLFVRLIKFNLEKPKEE